MQIRVFQSDKDAKFYFTFLSDSGKAVLLSQSYTTANARDNGIRSVLENIHDDKRIEYEKSKNDKHYFSLKSSNGQVVGASPMFDSKTELEATLNQFRKIDQNIDYKTLLVQADADSRANEKLSVSTSESGESPDSEFDFGKMPTIKSSGPLGSFLWEIYENSSDNKDYFHLKDQGGKIVLVSQGYSSAAACENGLQSVKRNLQNAANYEKKVAPDGQHYFDLVAGNGLIIASSIAYNAEATMNVVISRLKSAQIKKADLATGDSGRITGLAALGLSNKSGDKTKEVEGDRIGATSLDPKEHEKIKAEIAAQKERKIEVTEQAKDLASEAKAESELIKDAGKTSDGSNSEIESGKGDSGIGGKEILGAAGVVAGGKIVSDKLSPQGPEAGDTDSSKKISSSQESSKKSRKEKKEQKKASSQDSSAAKGKANSSGRTESGTAASGSSKTNNPGVERTSGAGSANANAASGGGRVDASITSTGNSASYSSTGSSSTLASGSRTAGGYSSASSSSTSISTASAGSGGLWSWLRWLLPILLIFLLGGLIWAFVKSFDGNTTVNRNLAGEMTTNSSINTTTARSKSVDNKEALTASSSKSASAEAASVKSSEVTQSAAAAGNGGADNVESDTHVNSSEASSSESTLLAEKPKEDPTETKVKEVVESSYKSPYRKGSFADRLAMFVHSGDSGNPILVLDRIRWLHNSARLNTGAYKQVDRLAEILKNNRNVKIEIRGHRDVTEKQDYEGIYGENITLALVRSRCLYKRLLKKGIPENQMTFVGFDDKQPLKEGNSDDALLANRRLEIRVLNK